MKNSIMLILAASSLLLAGCCSVHQAKRWEYKAVSSVDAANSMASEGWAVAGFSVDQNNTWVLLKRPKQ